MRLIGLTATQFQAVLERFNHKHRTSIGLAEHGRHSWGYGPKTGGVRRPWVQGQLKLNRTSDKYHRRKLPRYDFRTRQLERIGGRMPFVCWHGVRDLLRAVFAKYPSVTVRTGKAAYRGKDHFEQTFEQTDCNIGSQIFPLTFSEACDCKENGVNWEQAQRKAEYRAKVSRIVPPDKVAI